MYKLLPILLFVVINFSFSSEIPKYNEPEFYSIIALRNYTLSENIPFSFWNEHIDLGYFYDQHGVKPKNKTWVFTWGYRKPFKNINFQQKYIPFHNYFIGFELEGLNWCCDYDDYDHSKTWNNWLIGYGIGIKTSQNFQINLSAQYNIFTGVDDYAFDLEASDYLSFNLGIGYNTYDILERVFSLGKSKWTQFGIHLNKPTGKHYINSKLPQIDATEIGIELNSLLIGGGLGLFMYAWGMAEAESGSAGSDLYTPSSSAKGCHVFGKIKIVEFGEDYKVRAVDFGENLKVKYVSFGEGSVGKWKIVEFGEDYKVRFVDFGEDLKVRFVDFGEGCN
tara:strand:- start:33 stop:1037 length:1005 start_codon:yes stop_codon:yes gene_type:complete